MPIGAQKRSRAEIHPKNNESGWEISNSFFTGDKSWSNSFKIHSSVFKHNWKKKKWVTNVPISGIDDKRSITATLSINLEGKVINDMQLIYSGKTISYVFQR